VTGSTGSPGPFDDLELTPVPGGTRLRLRVKPGARKNAIVGVHGGALKISVTAPPEKGKANDAVVALLAKALDVPASALVIVAGETSQDKVIAAGLSAGEIRERLQSGAMTS
jgi:uncharacterized protein (TIGR00251 family)